MSTSSGSNSGSSRRYLLALADGEYSLTADAFHSLTDLVSDIMTLATISWSIRPATLRFPMGYGKIESLGALAISFILLGGGIGIGLQAVLALSEQFFPHIHEVLSHLGFLAHSHSHHDHDAGHAAAELGPNINAAWLAAGSIVIKEWLYRATMKVAKEKRSSVLSSNACSPPYHSLLGDRANRLRRTIIGSIV